MNILKRSLAYFLALAMMIVMIPVTAFAADDYEHTLIPEDDLYFWNNNLNLPDYVGNDYFFVIAGGLRSDSYDGMASLLVDPGSDGVIYFTVTGEADVTVSANCEFDGVSDLGLFDAEGNCLQTAQFSGMELVDVTFADLSAGNYSLRSGGTLNPDDDGVCATRIMAITVAETTEEPHEHSLEDEYVHPTCKNWGYTATFCSCGIVADIYDFEEPEHYWDGGDGCVACGIPPVYFEPDGDYLFHSTQVTAKADNELLPDGTYVGTRNYFRVDGTVYKNISASTGFVESIELEQEQGGRIYFEVVGTRATVDIGFASLMDGTTSYIAVYDADGNMMPLDNEGGPPYDWTDSATSGAVEWYLPAGTYYIASPFGQNTRIRYIEVYGDRPLLGSEERPLQIPEDGTFTTNYFDCTDGYYYEYVAPGNGTVTLTMEGKDWYYSFDNTTTGKHVNDGYSDDNPVEDVVVHKVSKGERLLLFVQTHETDYIVDNVSFTIEFEPAHEHSYQAVVTPPTCTERGYTTYTCACGNSYVTDYVDALGHSYSSSVTTQPGCETEGVLTYTCSKCGDTYTESIPATGHSHKAVVTAPTCTERGYTTYTCACGNSYVTDYVDALGHSYSSSVTTQPGCETEGVRTYTCSKCGDTYTESIPATGHSHKAVVTAPTCTERGYTTYTCACGDSYVTDYVDALGHSYESVTVPATCTEDGSITYTCSKCGDTYSETIPAHGHSYESVTVPPTSTEDGSITYTCTICGDTYVEIIPALGTDYADLFDLAGANMDLGNTLIMHFYVNMSDIQGTDYYIEMERFYPDGTSVTKQIPYAQWESYHGVMWMVTLDELAAKEMTDRIELTVYTTDGVQVSNTWVDSIRDYSMRILRNPEHGTTYTLLVDMLNYGTAAQTMFKYNLDDLANSTLTAQQVAYATQNLNLGNYNNNQIKGDNFIDSSLSLEPNIVLSMYFNKPVATSAEGLVAKVSYYDFMGHLHTCEVAEADFITMGYYHGVEVDTLVASDVRQLVTLEVYDGDTLVVYGADSMESYAVRNGGDIIIEMMKYTLSAYAFMTLGQL